MTSANPYYSKHSVDYLGTNASRATIRMTHDADGPTVSMSEARRYDQETSQRLLEARKLSLIVDLDQTILHATVDPTVGEWMEEAAQHEARKVAEAANRNTEEVEKAEAPDDGEINPNWAALSDVKRFKLGSDHSDDDGSYYYIKPRYVDYPFVASTS